MVYDRRNYWVCRSNSERKRGAWLLDPGTIHYPEHSDSGCAYLYGCFDLHDSWAHHRLDGWGAVFIDQAEVAHQDFRFWRRRFLVVTGFW